MKPEKIQDLKNNTPRLLQAYLSAIRDDGESVEKFLLEYSPEEIFDKALEYEGIINYGYQIRNLYKKLFGE